MSKTKQTPKNAAIPTGPSGFQPGHPRFSGRKKRTAAQARALADEMGVDPLEFMLAIINSDVIEQTVIENGEKKRVEVAIPLDTRLDAAKTVVNYIYPRLTAQQVTGKDDGPIEVAGLDIAKLLQDPAMVEMAQSLAIAMAQADRNPRPARICGPDDEQAQAARDPLTTLGRDPQTGHWK